VLAGQAAGEPKSGDGRAEMIRAFRSARQSAVKARSQAANQLQSFVVTAPKELRQRLRGLPTKLKRLVAEVAPGLISRPAIGTHHAATLLVVAGDNPQRLKSEASFASLCGVSPVEASSGKVVRHRLNRGGNRDANRELHMICVVRMGSDERTRRYVARRTAEGKSKWEIMRCLKRYIAREVYRVLLASAAAESPPNGITKPHLEQELLRT
jgi:transposase